MSDQVPLVVYRQGKRVVLGMAIVNKDGSIQAQISADQWPAAKQYLLPDVGELSISPVPVTQPIIRGLKTGNDIYANIHTPPAVQRVSEDLGPSALRETTSGDTPDHGGTAPG